MPKDDDDVYYPREEGQGDTSKESKAMKSKGRGLEEGASRALMRQVGEEGCGGRG